MMAKAFVKQIQNWERNSYEDQFRLELGTDVWCVEEPVIHTFDHSSKENLAS